MQCILLKKMNCDCILNMSIKDGVSTLLALKKYVTLVLFGKRTRSFFQCQMIQP